VEKSLSKISELISIILVLLVFLIVFDLSNRYLFSNGSIALQELEWHLFDTIMLFSLFFTLKHNGHVRVDIIYSTLSNKWKTYIDIGSHILFIIPFSIMIIYFSYGFVELSFIQNEISPNPNGLEYRFIVKSLILFGFSLLIIQSVLNITKLIKKV
jgi:TRAP-type mannitol/chloroaromatic compound transport system permease small subunit